MFTGTLTPISRRSTYTETLEITSADDGTLIDLTGATITVSIHGGEDSWPSVSGTLESGDVLVPSPGIIQWRFEQSTMSRLDRESYRLSVVVARDGDQVEILNATLPVED